MKRLLIGFLVVACLAIGTLAVMQSSHAQPKEVCQPPAPVKPEATHEVADSLEPAPSAIVFDMKYRGLSGEKNELRYNSYWGYGGGNKENSPFLKALKKDTKGLHAVYNPHFGKAQWAAVEVKDKEAVAFYFDLNADGKVAKNEKILPNLSEGRIPSGSWEFVTPDFVLKTNEGQQVPFRALLQVNFYGQSSRPNHMWSPSCVLEGKSTIAGKPTKLILYASGFSGSFKEFGRGSYSLLPADEQIGRNIPRQSLSSLVNHKGQYYRLKLHGNHEENKAIRASLEKYTGATGEMAVKLTGNSDLSAKLSSASLISTNDATIRFNISAGQSTLPAEAYEISRGSIDYGAENSDQCRVNFTKGPEFEVGDGTTCNVELGKPVLSVWAVEETKRGRSNVKQQSVYAKGANIYLQMKIRGKAGELYGRFSQRVGDSPRYKEIEPEIRIVDSDGKEVASAKMKYG